MRLLLFVLFWETACELAVKSFLLAPMPLTWKTALATTHKWIWICSSATGHAHTPHSSSCKRNKIEMEGRKWNCYKGQVRRQNRVGVGLVKKELRRSRQKGFFSFSGKLDFHPLNWIFLMERLCFPLLFQMSVWGFLGVVLDMWHETATTERQKAFFLFLLLFFKKPSAVLGFFSYKRRRNMRDVAFSSSSSLQYVPRFAE